MTDSMKTRRSQWEVSVGEILASETSEVRDPEEIVRILTAILPATPHVYYYKGFTPLRAVEQQDGGVVSLGIQVFATDVEDTQMVNIVPSVLSFHRSGGEIWDDLLILHFTWAPQPRGLGKDGEKDWLAITSGTDTFSRWPLFHQKELHELGEDDAKLIFDQMVTKGSQPPSPDPTAE